MDDSDDTTSTDTSQDLRVMNSIPDADTHDYEKVDQTHLLDVAGCTAYELTLKCQNEGCSQETNPILAQGDLPVTVEEINDFTCEIYRWFYDNFDEIPPFAGDSSLYSAPYMMVPGEEKDPALLKCRIALFIAADVGYQDGLQEQPPKQKQELLSDVQYLAHVLIQRIEATQGSIHELFE